MLAFAAAGGQSDTSAGTYRFVRSMMQRETKRPLEERERLKGGGGHAETTFENKTSALCAEEDCLHLVSL